MGNFLGNASFDLTCFSPWPFAPWRKVTGEVACASAAHLTQGFFWNNFYVRTKLREILGHRVVWPWILPPGAKATHWRCHLRTGCLGTLFWMFKQSQRKGHFGAPRIWPSNLPQGQRSQSHSHHQTCGSEEKRLMGANSCISVLTLSSVAFGIAW